METSVLDKKVALREPKNSTSALIMENDMQKQLSNSSYYSFGYRVFGPFLYGFSSWLREKLKQDHIKKVFFFSRDGFMMQRAYELFEKSEPLGIDFRYVYFSRNSIRRVLLWNCDTFENSLQYLSLSRFVSMSELVSYYGLKLAEISDYLAAQGLKPDDNFAFGAIKSDERLKSFYENFKALIDARSKSQYEALRIYLAQIGLDDDCAIVDIGWHGTMQYYLDRVIALMGKSHKITGYYVGINPLMALNGASNGFLFEKDNLKLRKPILCFLGVSEKFFQSMEGSTDNYTIEGGCAAPVLKEYEYSEDSLMQTRIVELQTASLSYVEDAIREAVPPTRKLIKPMLRFGMSPSLAEVKLFENFYITDGERQYFLPQKGLFSYSLREFALALSKSPWKTGFLKAAFKIPFPYYLIYKLLRK